MSGNTTTLQQEKMGEEDEGLASSLANLRSILNIDNSPTKSSHSTSVVLRGFERITEVESQLKEEKSLRQKQEESYEALSKYNKELAMQLELLNKSRAKLEDRFNTSDRALQAEKAQLAKEQTERKTEMEKMEKEKSESLNEIERLKARNLFFQRQNEELKVFHQQSKDLKAELEAQTREMEEKQAHFEERHKKAVRMREELEQRLEETKSTMKAELEEAKFELSGTKDEVSGAMGSLSSFLTAMKDDADEDDDYPLSDLDTLVIKVGAVMEEMRTTIEDIQNEKGDLARELNIARSENEDAAMDLASSREKWHKARNELMDLKEDYEEQSYRIAELEKIVDGDEDEEVSPSPKGSGDEGDASDSPDGSAIDVESNDPESPMSASSDEEEEPTPPHQRVIEIDSPDSHRAEELESESPDSLKSSHPGEELLSPAKRSADVLDAVLDEGKLEEDDNYEQVETLQGDDHESPTSPKRLKVTEDDHHSIDI